MQWLINWLLNRGNDLSTFFLPNAYFFKRYILEFKSIPLFNPIRFLGQSYIADPQNYIFYPLNYFFVFFPIEPTFIFLLLGHLVLAGWFTYILAKKTFSLTRPASIFAALLYALCPMLISHLEAGHYTMIIAFAWLPLFFHLMFKFTQKPSLKLSCYLSLVSWILYINYISIAYFAMFFFGLYFIFCLLFKKLKHPLKHYALCSMLYVAIFVGLISPVLLPQLEFARLTTRELLTLSDIAHPLWSFKLFFQNLFFPFNLDYNQFSTERVLFSGLIVYILAVFGFIKRKKFDCFAIFWILFSLTFVLGTRLPFFKLYYKFLPMLKYMRVTTRMWLISILVIIIPYTALGFQKILLQKKVIATIIAILAIAELMFINYKILSRPVQKDQLPQNFYQIIANDSQNNFRVYCTTGCFSQQTLGKLGIYSLSGNNPVHTLEFVQKLQAAAGYRYDQYIPVYPPYPVFDQKPQPDARLMANLNTKYLASPYPLSDPEFKLLLFQDNYYLYLNQNRITPQSSFNYTLKSFTISMRLYIISLVIIIYASCYPQLFSTVRSKRR